MRQAFDPPSPRWVFPVYALLAAATFGGLAMNEGFLPNPFSGDGDPAGPDLRFTPAGPDGLFGDDPVEDPGGSDEGPAPDAPGRPSEEPAPAPAGERGGDGDGPGNSTEAGGGGASPGDPGKPRESRDEPNGDGDEVGDEDGDEGEEDGKDGPSGEGNDDAPIPRLVHNVTGGILEPGASPSNTSQPAGGRGGGDDPGDNVTSPPQPRNDSGVA